MISLRRDSPSTTTPAAAIPSPPKPQALLAQAGLAAKKSWGQNFLLDQRVLAAIAELAGAAPGRVIVELGAGLGALTYHLLARGAQVTAIERDREIAPLLAGALAWAGVRLEIVEADAASLDYAALAARLGSPLTVTGNLPYQLSSRILVSLAEVGAPVGRAVLLVQREVAERLTAAPGSRIYGLLSVLVQRRFTARLARHVSPAAFLPRPKVDSAVVVLDVHAGPECGREADAALVEVARAAFHSRRKMLRSGLAAALAVTAAALEPAFTEARVSPTARAEELAVDDFTRLGAALAARGLLQ